MKLIAEGRTAEVYEWEGDYVLKLFRHGFDNADYEAQMARLVVDSGVNAPRLIETLQINGRNGIVYERVSGRTMLQVLRSNIVAVTSVARRFADIQYQMHQKHAPSLPSVKQKLQSKISRASHLTDAQKQQISTYLATLPDGDVVCHGDLHPENIIITPDGAKIIDWIDASCGHPAADVARSVIILTIGDIPGSFWMRWLFAGLRSLFSYGYLKRYYARSTITRHDVAQWMVPVAAARLSEDIEPVEPLLRIINRGLQA